MNLPDNFFSLDPIAIVARRLDKPHVRMLSKWMVLRLLRRAVVLETENRDYRRLIACYERRLRAVELGMELREDV